LCQLKQPEIRKLFEKKCKEKLEIKCKPKINDYNNIEHGWRYIKESIVQSAEEILTREVGLEPYLKEPVLEPEPFEYWEPEPHRNPNLIQIHFKTGTPPKPLFAFI
jgi:hypothetical protein